MNTLSRNKDDRRVLRSLPLTDKLGQLKTAQTRHLDIQKNQGNVFKQQDANIVTTAGSSFNQIVFLGVGHTIGLACVSTAGGSNGGPVWIATSPPSPGLTISTF